MENDRRMPIGIELVRKGIVTETQIKEALEYQKKNKKMKLGEILKEITSCDPKVLIEAIGDILGEKQLLKRHFIGLIDIHQLVHALEDGPQALGHGLARRGGQRAEL